MNRSELISELTRLIVTIERPHPTQVAMDGVDAAGKTVLANELVAPLQAQGRQVIRVSIDGFHHSRDIRHRRGPDSPEGYYLDSFDYDALKTLLLDLLGPGGNLLYHPAVFDFRSDSAVPLTLCQAQPDSILIFDGVFLLRPELYELWDFKVFIDVDFAIAVQRASQHNQALFGTAEQVQEQYYKRYVPGQRLYLKSCQPQDRADVVVNNNDPARPEMRFVHSWPELGQ